MTLAFSPARIALPLAAALTSAFAVAGALPASAAECVPTVALDVTSAVDAGTDAFVYASVKGCANMTVTTKLEASTDQVTWAPMNAATQVTMTSDIGLAYAFDDFVKVPKTTTFRFTAGDQVRTAVTKVNPMGTQLVVDSSKRIGSIGATLVKAGTVTKLANRPLALQTRSSSTAPWRTVGTLRTNAYGYAATEVHPNVPSDYRLLFAGDAQTAPTATGARRIAGYVRALPRMTASNHRYSTKMLRLDGHPLAGLRVAVYRKVPGGYRPVTSAVTNRYGVATVRLTPGKRTTYAWFWGGSTSWQDARSADFTVAR